MPTPGLRIAPGADSTSIADTLDAIEGLVRQSGMPDETVDRVILAAGEAVANVAEHGTTVVSIRWSRTERSGCLSFLGDIGPGGQRIHEASLPPTEAIGGRGLFLIRTLTDRVVAQDDRLDLYFVVHND